MEFAYKKSLGQNFIYDTAFLQSLVAGLQIDQNDRVVEIGAGAGTLTKVLAGYGCQVHAIEIDQRLQPILQNNWQDLVMSRYLLGMPCSLTLPKWANSG